LKPEDIFLSHSKLIDVRAPIEFSEGHLPGAVNLPLLNDEERAAVGTCYKQKGREAAIELGHQLISGAVKETRIQAWRDYLRENPEAILYCFRGGLRSQITQRWLEDCGLKRPLIHGGYKSLRNFLLEQIANFKAPLLVTSGATGSGKTELIWNLSSVRPCLDLEGLANHRGSAFGNMATPQPSQALFENMLAVEILKLSTSEKPIIIEDESRLVGKCVIPNHLFDQMRASSIVLMDIPIEERAEHILKHYVSQPIRSEGSLKVYGGFKFSLGVISKKLGGLMAREILTDIELAEKESDEPKNHELNLIWITKLLKHYYDPLYLGSLERRQVKVAFRGSRQECFDYLKS
jgi:tRNA 2-selenouridine synthase